MRWADSGTGQEWYPFSQYWGSAFGDAAAAYWSRLGSTLLGPQNIKSPGAWGGFAEALAFYTPLGTAADISALPTSKVYEYAGVGVFRSTWNAPAAAQTYLAFKGGNSSWNHNRESRA